MSNPMEFVQICRAGHMLSVSLSFSVLIGCWAKKGHHPLQPGVNKQPQQLKQVPSFVMQHRVCACVCLCVCVRVQMCVCACLRSHVHACAYTFVYVCWTPFSGFSAVVCTLINDCGARESTNRAPGRV